MTSNSRWIHRHHRLVTWGMSLFLLGALIVKFYFKIPAEYDTHVILGAVFFLMLDMAFFSALRIEPIDEALSQLVDTQRTIVRAVRSLTDSRTPTLDALTAPRLRSDGPPRFELKSYAADAADITLVGISFRSFVHDNQSLIEQILQRNIPMHFIITDKDAPFLDRFDVNMVNHTGDPRADIESSIKILERLKAHGKLTYRTYGGTPNFTAFRVRPRNRPSVIWVEYYSYGLSASERRGLLVREDESPDTYKFFNTSIENLRHATEAQTGH